MKKIHQTAQFKRDLKKIRRAVSKDVLKDLDAIIQLLLVGSPLPPRCRDHGLTGDLDGFRDCHIRPDLLLLYQQTPEILLLVRLASHAEMFG